MMCKHATAPLSETPQHRPSSYYLSPADWLNHHEFQRRNFRRSLQLYKTTFLQTPLTGSQSNLRSEEHARTLLYRTITTAIDVMSRFTVGSNLTTCMTAALYSSFHSTVPRQCTQLCTDSVQNCTPICTVLTAIPSISFREGINFSRLYHLI